MPATRPRRVLLLLALLTAAWLATTGTAQAHTTLSSSSPAEGSTVGEALTAVVLTFSGAVRGPEVTLSGPDGAAVATGPAAADGSTVSVPVSPTATGAHTVGWAVTSADGHRLEGTLAFTYAGPVPPAGATTAEAPTTEAPTTEAPTTEIPAPATATTGSSPTAARPAATAEEDGGSSSGVAVGAAVAVVLLGTGGALAARRRSG